MNVMTEEEAKGKWCPFARSTTSRTITENMVPRFIAMASANRDDGDDAGPLYSLCIASGCMTWRWAWSDNWQEIEGSDGLSQRRLPSSTHGYCGLAGSPTP